MQQLDNYKSYNSILVRTDSIRLMQIEGYRRLSSAYDEKFIQLNKELKQKNKAVLGWKIGGVTVSVGILLLLILK